MTGDGVARGSGRRGRLARSIVLAAALAVVGAAAGRTAHADMPRDTPTAIEVDRDATPAGRVGFGFDGGEPVDAWGASIAAGWIERPIRLGSGTFGGGSPASQPVRRRETLSLGGALALGDSMVIDLGLRASHQVGDRLLAAGNPEALARYVFHDVRFGGRIRVAGNRERAAMLRADLTLPSGNVDQFAGDASWTIAWSLIGRATLPHDLVMAANAGIRLHGAEVAVGDRLVGDEFFAAAGVAVPVPQVGPLRGLAGPVKLTGELLGSLGDHVGKLSGPSPLEARLGVIVQPLPELTIGAHAGLGLDEQIGAPRFRAVVELAWTPRIARRPVPASSARPTEPSDELEDELDVPSDVAPDVPPAVAPPTAPPLPTAPPPTARPPTALPLPTVLLPTASPPTASPTIAPPPTVPPAGRSGAVAPDNASSQNVELLHGALHQDGYGVRSSRMAEISWPES